MGQQCRTCAHPSRLEIERLRKGGTTLEDLSAEYGLTASTINRHMHNPRCRARWEAVDCAPEAAQAAAAGPATPGRSTPVQAVPMRRRAIAGGARLMQPVASDNDPGGSAAASIVPFRSLPAAPVYHQPKSSLTTNPQELALLQTIGYNAEQIAGLLGGDGSYVAECIEESYGKKRCVSAATRPQWANQCIRLRVDYLFSLRRHQQAAMDNRQHRVARQYNADIDRAMSQLFKTLELFGLVGPIDPSEVSKEGDDARDILGMMVAAIGGREPLVLTDKQEGCVDREVRRLADRHHAIA